MPERLVSVVIPAFNREHTLLRAVDSVRSQTYRCLEAVVVDDGSTDGTWDVLQDLARGDTRVRAVRHERARGAQAARNLGIRASSGDWIAFLDSDDEWLLDSLSVRLRVAYEQRVEVVHSECWQDNGGGEPHLFGVPPYAGASFGAVLRHPGPMYQGLLVTRSALTRIGDLDENIVAYQEWDIAIRLAQYYRFAFVPGPTFIYHCSGADTISKQAMLGAVGYEQVYRKHRRQILLHAGPFAVAANHHMLAHLFTQAGDPEKARQYRLLATVDKASERGRLGVGRLVRAARARGGAG